MTVDPKELVVESNSFNEKDQHSDAEQTSGRTDETSSVVSSLPLSDVAESKNEGEGAVVVTRKQRKRAAREAWRSSGVGWRVFPRTLLGILTAILMFSVGAGVSGAILFAYYESRVTDSENKITEFSSGLDQRIAEGVDAVETASATADQRISAVLGPYAELLQNEGGLPRVAGPAAPSTVLVETRNLEGGAVTGSAVAIGEGGDGVLLVAAFSVVNAAAADPGPDIILRKGDEFWGARLLSWDESLGVAILTSDASLPVAPFAPADNLGILIGSPVFAVSALNDAVSPGVVVAVTEDGFRHTGTVDTDFLGGPIVEQNGQIVGFSIKGYAPDGVPGESLPWSPTITQICDTLLVCENSNATLRD